MATNTYQHEPPAFNRPMTNGAAIRYFVAEFPHAFTTSSLAKSLAKAGHAASAVDPLHALQVEIQRQLRCDLIRRTFEGKLVIGDREKAKKCR